MAHGTHPVEQGDVDPELEGVVAENEPFVWTKSPADIIRQAVRRGR